MPGMQIVPRLLTTILVVVGMAVSGCGSADAPDPEPNLLKEYWESPAVKNDRMPGYGAAPEDRQANLASFYSPEQLLSQLLGVFTCTDRTGTSQRGANRFDTSCDLNTAVRRAVREAGGDTEHVTGRVVLVKHPDGALELLTLFIVNGKAIDSDGKTYSGLDEFRAGNDLLDTDDVIFVPRELTKVAGETELVTVYGHTRWDGGPWLLGGGGVLVLVVMLLLIRRNLRRSRQRDDQRDDGSTHSGGPPR
jgi:hypothetical protein